MDPFSFFTRVDLMKPLEAHKLQRNSKVIFSMKNSVLSNRNISSPGIHSLVDSELCPQSKSPFFINNKKRDIKSFSMQKNTSAITQPWRSAKLSVVKGLLLDKGHRKFEPPKFELLGGGGGGGY
jgi:hypothetical protein